MNELALFAGAGGGILGGKLLGWRTVCAVEKEPYRIKILLQRQRDGILDRFPIWDDITTFDPAEWVGRCDIITGGFPCQDISCAGKGAGIDGEKSGLWKHMRRVVCEIRPKFVFVENSPMLTGRGLGTVLGDLAEMGYNARWCVLGAADAGAPHKRERIWILAYSSKIRRNPGRAGKPLSRIGVDGKTEQMAHSNSERLEKREGKRKDNEQKQQATFGGGCEWWESDPADIPDANELNDDLGGFGASEIQRERSEKAKIPGCKISDAYKTDGETCGTNTMGDRKQKKSVACKNRRPTQPELGRVAHGMAEAMDKDLDTCYDDKYENKHLFKTGAKNNEVGNKMPDMRSKRETTSPPQKQRQDKQHNGEFREAMPKLPQDNPCKSWGLGAWKDKIKSGELQDMREIVYSKTLSRQQKEFLVWFGSMHGRKRAAECLEAMGKTERACLKKENRVDRLKAIGDGQVPAVAALAFVILSEGFF